MQNFRQVEQSFSLVTRIESTIFRIGDNGRPRLVLFRTKRCISPIEKTDLTIAGGIDYSRTWNIIRVSFQREVQKNSRILNNSVSWKRQVYRQVLYYVSDWLDRRPLDWTIVSLETFYLGFINLFSRCWIARRVAARVQCLQ